MLCSTSLPILQAFDVASRSENRWVPISVSITSWLEFIQPYLCVQQIYLYACKQKQYKISGQRSKSCSLKVDKLYFNWYCLPSIWVCSVSKQNIWQPKITWNKKCCNFSSFALKNIFMKLYKRLLEYYKEIIITMANDGKIISCFHHFHLYLMKILCKLNKPVIMFLISRSVS